MRLVILPRNRDDTVQLRTGYDFTKRGPDRSESVEAKAPVTNHRGLESTMVYGRGASYNRDRINDILSWKDDE